MRKLLIILAVVAGVSVLIVGGALWYLWGLLQTPEPVDLRIHGTFDIGRRTVSLYSAEQLDATVIGFSVAEPGKETLYYPMDAAIDEDFAPMTITAYVSKDEDELWITSSSNGGTELAYHMLGSDHYIRAWGG